MGFRIRKLIRNVEPIRSFLQYMYYFGKRFGIHQYHESGFLQNMVTLEFKSSPDCHQNFLQRQMVKFLKPVSNTSYLVRKNLTLMETFTFQCIPYLVAISTDNERLCHVKAEQCLNDIDGRYQGFIHMKALQGVKMAYEVQKVIQKVRMKFDTVSTKIRVVNVFQGSSRNFTNI